MEDYGALQKALIKKALLISLAVACICLVSNQKAAAKGISLGAVFGVADFKLMALLLPRRLARQSRITFYLSLICRFVLLSVPLILALKLPSFNFAATVVGLLLMKAAVLFHFFISKRLTPSVGPSKTNKSSRGALDVAPPLLSEEKLSAER